MPNVSLPSITSKVPMDLRAFVDRVREALNGSTFVTRQEYERLQQEYERLQQEYERLQKAAPSYALLNGSETEDFAAKALAVDALLLRGTTDGAKIYQSEGGTEITLHVGGADRIEVTSEGHLLPAGVAQTLGSNASPWSKLWTDRVQFGSSSQLYLHSDGTTLLFNTAGQDWWGIDGLGNLSPRANGVRNLGGSTARVKEVWTDRVAFGTSCYIDGGSELHFATSGGTRWRVGASGNLVPQYDNYYSVGLSSARVSTVWAYDVSYLSRGAFRSLAALEDRVAALESA